MKFYQKTSGVWVLDNRDIPAGTCYKVTEGDKIYIRKMTGELVEQGATYASFADSSDVAYASLVAFEAATDNFFISNDATALIEAVQNSGGITYGTMQVEIERPADQTPYTAGDVIADVSAAFIQFANVSKDTGTGVHITRVRLQTDDTAVAGLKFNVHLYKEAPTFIADNAAFAVSYANATKRSGNVPVVMGTGTAGTVGMNDYNQLVIKPTARDIYFIIETVSAFTASANSTKWTVVIDYELSNA